MAGGPLKTDMELHNVGETHSLIEGETAALTPSAPTPSTTTCNLY
jgi:hypothetical protein